ncbi:MAG TPA: type III-B CRISPR module RAMP protein Cmr4 [Proteobacteria bacterium]|nr:type III-B CRISPR module RAMP protein Cmr4 [Pseudomonadota bacterium]
MFIHKSYIIETLTNTHVGSGDTSFGTVDNLIQKDPVTSLPMFHSSSIKGAIKEHMENNKNAVISEADLNLIFGEREDKPGVVKFYDARLLTLPLRSTRRVSYQCTSPETVLDYLKTIETFKTARGLESLKKFFNDLKSEFGDKEFLVFNDDANNEKYLEIEDYGENKKYPIADPSINGLVSQYMGVDINNLAVFTDEIFYRICKESLPVIARNKIGDDGTSENLFYEEVLPRRSRLWFMLGFDRNIPVNSQFETKLTFDLIQMGANASIGYGVTRIRLTGGGV